MLFRSTSELSDLGSSVLVKSSSNIYYYASLPPDLILPNMKVGSFVSLQSRSNDFKSVDSGSFSSSAGSINMDMGFASDKARSPSQEQGPASGKARSPSQEQGPTSGKARSPSQEQGPTSEQISSSASIRKKTHTVIKLLPDMDLHSR